jgi:hypothetical protein
VRPGRASDLLFNPHADDYLQPLYPPADDSQRRAGPSPQDWQRQREHEDRPAPRRGERLPDRRLDTAEYARPLYLDRGDGPATGVRPKRSRRDDDPGPATDPRRDRADRAAFTAASSSQRTIADRPAGQATDARAPQSTPQVQPAVKGKPARKPQKTSGPNAGKDRPRAGQGRPRPGKGRPAASSARSAAGRRAPAKVVIMLGAAMVAALAVAGYVVFRPQTSHVVSAPANLGGYVRQQANATANDLRQRIVAAAGGAVKSVVAAVYRRTTGPGTNKGPQVVMFIGGNLTGGASADSLIDAYISRLRGAVTTSAGSLGGKAACAPGSNGGPAECAWADNDTFGVVVSATLTSASLGDVMRQIRPLVEHVAR